MRAAPFRGIWLTLSAHTDNYNSQFKMEAIPLHPAMIDSQNRSSKTIPLLCSVCPDTPRFSDVSHLLTHIASKGHLHHETQMRLKSHQDLTSSVSLQQYEQWYRDNGIEGLLVERMKAKQVKEAARSKRNRTQSSLPPKVCFSITPKLNR
jgi:hypothetical protein